MPSKYLTRRKNVLPQQSRFQTMPKPVRDISSFKPSTLRKSLRYVKEFFQPPERSKKARPFTSSQL